MLQCPHLWCACPPPRVPHQDLVAQCLVKVSDLSERDLVRVFRFIAGQVTDKAVTAFRDAVLPASAKAAAGSVPREFMVEYFV